MSIDLLRLAGATTPAGGNVALNLSAKEIQKYSVGGALNACRMRDTRPSYERELSVECWRRMKRSGDPAAYEMVVPYEIFWARRDLSVAAGGGSYLTEDRVPMLADQRPRGLVRRAGATFITGASANVSIAREDATATIRWLTSETDSASESAQTITQVPLVPKTVSVYVERSRLLSLLAPALSELLIRRDLARLADGALDAAAINGSGTNGQPLGIVGTPDVGTVTGTSIAWAGILEAQSDVLSANALVNPGAFGYVTTPAIAETLSKRQGFSTNAPIWQGPLDAGTVGGAPAFSSTSVPAATIIAGDWSQLVICEFGPGVEVRVNPYADFPAGIVGFAMFYTVDCAVTFPTAFSVATSVN